MRKRSMLVTNRRSNRRGSGSRSSGAAMSEGRSTPDGNFNTTTDRRCSGEARSESRMTLGSLGRTGKRQGL